MHLSLATLIQRRDNLLPAVAPAVLQLPMPLHHQGCVPRPQNPCSTAWGMLIVLLQRRRTGHWPQRGMLQLDMVSASHRRALIRQVQCSRLQQQHSPEELRYMVQRIDTISSLYGLERIRRKCRSYHEPRRLREQSHLSTKMNEDYMAKE